MTAEIRMIILLSLKISCAATLINLPGAVMTALFMTRRHFAGKELLDGILNLPLVLPPVVTGYLLLLLLGTRGPLGGLLYDFLGLRIAFTQGASIIAAMVVSFPLILRSVRVSLEMVDPRLEKAAATLGAGPGSVFFRVTLPLIYPGVITGCVMGFARCLGEFGATVTFAGNIAGRTRTLPLAVYSLLQVPGREGEAAALVVVSILLSLGAMLLSSRLGRRGGPAGDRTPEGSAHVR